MKRLLLVDYHQFSFLKETSKLPTLDSLEAGSDFKEVLIDYEFSEDSNEPFSLSKKTLELSNRLCAFLDNATSDVDIYFCESGLSLVSMIKSKREKQRQLSFLINSVSEKFDKVCLILCGSYVELKPLKTLGLG